MRIAFERVGNQVAFRIEAFEPKYEPVFKSCYYRKDDRGYFKQFPANCMHMDRIQNRFSLYAQTMFDQLGRFAEVPWQDALRSFSRIMEDNHLEWWLTGSCATQLHGIEIGPHDIDAMVRAVDVPRITDVLKDFLIEPIVDTDGWVTKDFGVCFLTARIDIASDPSATLDDPEPADCGPFAFNHLEHLQWQGFDIRVPPLELQVNVNRRRGRMDRVEKIEAFLRANQES
jgi:hypothetical protein